MKLAHLADVHLGFRQYHRLTRRGINQREADVAAVFRRAIDDVIAARPDLVIVAGDLFHSVRPTNSAILHSFNQFRRLCEALPGTPIVIIAGNHDTPRSVETGSILKLFEALPRVTTVAQGPRELVFPEHDLAVLCVPHAALAADSRPPLLPGTSAGRRVLVAHGEVAGVIPRGSAALEYGGAVVQPEELHIERWDYVALGHYHVTHRVAPNAWYAGALEYVSSNPWGELQAGRGDAKGWLLVDLADGVRVQFRAVPLARRLIDLEPISARGKTAAEVSALVAARVDGVRGGVDGHIVRQVVYDIPRAVARELDHALVREVKTRALHYHLDLRRPQPRRAIGVGEPGVRQTLTDLLAEYLARRPLGADVDRARTVALGRRYMEEVERELREG